MGFDIRVNNGRCPPFLLGGCILLVVILICNWWSFSPQNYDLLKQINILEDQMRICSGERDHCTIERNKLETNAGQLKIQIDHQKLENEKKITMCKTELESLKNLDTSKTETLKTLRANLEEKKEEIKRLSEETKRLNDQIKLLTAHKQAESLFKQKGDSAKKAEILRNNEDVDDATEKGNDGERDFQMANNT